MRRAEVQEYVGDSAGDVAAIAGEGVSHTTALAAERYRIEGMIVSAHQWPRDERTARAATLQACARPRFADGAIYEYPRGRTTVTGPSVRLAREVARCWRNILTGYRIVDMDDTWITVEGYAHDLEANRVEIEQARFKRKIMRRPKGGGKARWVSVEDERELAELVGRNAAKKVRNCILRLIPSDLIEEALEECSRTLVAAAEADLRAAPADAIAKMTAAFAEIGVTSEMLHDHLVLREGAALSARHVARLRGVYRAIKDGEASARDFFDLQDQTPVFDPGIDEAQVERVDPDDVALFRGIQ